MKLFCITLMLVLLAGCASGPSIDKSYTATGQGSRVQYVVLHYTSTNLPRSLELFTTTDVSSHYLIDSNPATIYQLVDENRRAWHAGVSSWKGRTWLNSTTIGIEMVNKGYTDTPSGQVWQPYTEAQIQALISLLKDIAKRPALPLGSIIGHSDVAPQRKVDPGPYFPWKRLADEGLVPWPDANEVARKQAQLAANLPNIAWFQHQLARQGYEIIENGQLDKQTLKVLAAFQMKYRPSNYSGEADAQTAAMLLVLNSKL
ncbi:N-acetylmuramoyl-L-alanine amidase [Pseudomonas sp. S9]|uniref:N-acetylmuramoyl-L-alanine amidase n=1 Tax=Pseudomonas sp. S9 TaxID=686578 RepID=UPI000255722E|nr:N-acetylmuramoyl-L-alanine amidase [Pseudomonas sp. S9]